MPELVIHAADFSEGYQIASTSSGLRIKSSDHHAAPLHLDRKQLAKFGLQFKNNHHIPLKNGTEPEGVLDSMIATVLRATKLMSLQRNKKEWEWDIKNLRRALVILGGLDEKVVEAILREEGL
jgi:hypothetical protein